MTNNDINKKRTLVSWRKTMFRHIRSKHPSKVRYVKKWARSEVQGKVINYGFTSRRGNQVFICPHQAWRVGRMSAELQDWILNQMTDAVMDKCVYKNKEENGYSITCKLGLWAAYGPQEMCEREARRMFIQYLRDGEYDGLLEKEQPSDEQYGQTHQRN